MRKIKNGFTLVELVIVVIILGILAVVAAPKFISMDRDAKIASLKGVKGALESTFTGFQAKTYMPSADITITNNSGHKRQYLNINDHQIEFTNKDHKPKFDRFLDERVALTQLKSLADINLSLVNEGGDLFASFECSANSGFYIVPKTRTDFLETCDVKGEQCFIRYRASESGDGTILTLITDDC